MRTEGKDRSNFSSPSVGTFIILQLNGLQQRATADNHRHEHNPRVQPSRVGTMLAVFALAREKGPTYPLNGRFRHFPRYQCGGTDLFLIEPWVSTIKGD